MMKFSTNDKTHVENQQVYIYILIYRRVRSFAFITRLYSKCCLNWYVVYRDYTDNKVCLSVSVFEIECQRYLVINQNSLMNHFSGAGAGAGAGAAAADTWLILKLTTLIFFKF